jgi:hypothetical protein
MSMSVTQGEILGDAQTKEDCPVSGVILEFRVILHCAILHCSEEH